MSSSISMKADLEKLLGKRINVFIDNSQHPNLRKNYVGELGSVEAETIVLNLDQPQFVLSVTIRIQLISIVFELRHKSR